MIEARNLTVTVRGRKLVDDVSLRVEAGDVGVIIGPNGAGKSTLLRALAGDQSFDGEVRIAGRLSRDWPARQLAQRRAVLPQAARVSFPFTALEIVLLGRAPHLAGAEQPRDFSIAHAALEKSGAAHLAHRRYPTLSGGEQQRVQFARVLAQIWESPDPAGRCLLLDEPIASLDLAHQHGVLETARRLAAENVAVLAVLHDLNLAARYCDRLFVLNQGRLVGDGHPRDVLSPSMIESVFEVRAAMIHHPAQSSPVVLTTALR